MPRHPRDPGRHTVKLEALLSRLLHLHEMGVADDKTSTREQVCHAIMEYACELVGSTRGSLMLLDEENGELRIISSKGLPPKLLKTRLKPGEGVAGRVFKSGQAIFISDPKKDPRYVRYQATPESQEPVVSVPIKIREKTVGVLNLHQTAEALPFDDLNVKFLTLLAAEAAKSIENLDLYDDLQNFYMELVGALARALDKKDAYTHEHSDRSRKRARLNRRRHPEQSLEADPGGV